MDRDTINTYCEEKKGVTWDYPFDEYTLVYRVMGKIFVLMPTDADPARVNLKCDPAWAEILRQTYPAVTPGYHMNKVHWNTVLLDGSIPEDEIYAMIDESYAQVVKGLKKADREKLQAESDEA